MFPGEVLLGTPQLPGVGDVVVGISVVDGSGISLAVASTEMEKHRNSFEGATKFADSRAGRNPGKTSCFPNS